MFEFLGYGQGNPNCIWQTIRQDLVAHRPHRFLAVSPLRILAVSHDTWGSEDCSLMVPFLYQSASAFASIWPCFRWVSQDRAPARHQSAHRPGPELLYTFVQSLHVIRPGLERPVIVAEQGWGRQGEVLAEDFVVQLLLASVC